MEHATSLPECNVLGNACSNIMFYYYSYFLYHRYMNGPPLRTSMHHRSMNEYTSYRGRIPFPIQRITNSAYRFQPRSRSGNRQSIRSFPGEDFRRHLDVEFQINGSFFFPFDFPRFSRTTFSLSPPQSRRLSPEYAIYVISR